MIPLYKLEGKIPVLIDDADDFLRWLDWYETADREVRRTILPTGEKIVTTFLGMDLGFNPDEPQVFETMFFFENDEPVDTLHRCSTWERAEASHESAVRFITKLHAGLNRISDGESILSAIKFDCHD